MQEIEDMTQFKQSKMTLPLARIKKIMKFDEDVKVWAPCSLFYLAWLGLCCYVYAYRCPFCGHAHR